MEAGEEIKSHHNSTEGKKICSTANCIMKNAEEDLWPIGPMLTKYVNHDKAKNVIYYLLEFVRFMG